MATSMVHAVSGAAVVEPEPQYGGEYQALHAFLRARFAGRVVLTLPEVEDLLGSPLPPRARLDPAWWGATDPLAAGSRHADAWLLANRVATVNLPAGTVVFERREPVTPRRR